MTTLGTLVSFVNSEAARVNNSHCTREGYARTAERVEARLRAEGFASYEAFYRTVEAATTPKFVYFETMLTFFSYCAAGETEFFDRFVANTAEAEAAWENHTRLANI